jgi:hypothetical protein
LFSRSSSNQYGGNNGGTSSGGHGHKRSLSSVSQVAASALERGRGEYNTACAVYACIDQKFCAYCFAVLACSAVYGDRFKQFDTSVV